MKSIILAFALFVAAFAPVSPASATEYKATLIRIIDADTQEYMVHLWPGLTMQVFVRVKWIDTPETRRPSKECRELERNHGREATAYVKELLKYGDEVIIYGVELGKYAGRVLGHILLKDNSDLGALLIDRRFAVEYHGGKKPNWCEILK